MGIIGKVDDRGRIVLPKRLREELGLSNGDSIVFEKIGEYYALKKLATTKRLEEIMSWNPQRTAEPEPISPQEMKRIWKA
jgi:AbrB family looped-hinge helix DNA binding protein